MPKSEISLSEIESGLERLMPRGLSDSALSELEAVVDELAADSKPVRFSQKSRFRWAIAAALVLAGISLFWSERNHSPNSSSTPTMASLVPLDGVSVLEQGTWIERGADLGIHVVDESGEAHRGYGYVGVEEERVLHETSGFEVVLQREFEAEFYAAGSL